MTNGTLCPGTVVLDGYVYAIGGFDDVNYLSSVERYDPEQHQWEAVPPMASKRSHLGVTVLNGRVYAVAGFNGDKSLNSVERYDPFLKICT